MSEGGYKIRNQAAIHFITFAVVGWVDVFTRKDYRDMVTDIELILSGRYAADGLIKNKGKNG